MTLILGIRCADGIVLGSDGAATFSQLGTRTIRQPTKKISIIDGCVAVGVSGPVGLAQRFAYAVETLWNDPKKILRSETSPVNAGVLLRRQMWPHLEIEFLAATTAQKVLGPLAQESVITSTLVALPIKKRMELLQFDQQGTPEVVTDLTPFAAVGSGQAIADPFLGFLRKIFFRDRPPSIQGGAFAILWTLRHAIDTNAGGVDDPCQVFVMKNEDCKAKELSPEEREELEESVEAAEKHLLAFRSTIDGSSDVAVEPPPEPG